MDAPAEARSSIQEPAGEHGAATAPVDQGQVGEAVESLNQYAQSVQRQLEFSVDEESGKTIIKVIDAETGETIRDIPPEEVLNMQKKLKETSDQMFHREESSVSLLFQGKA
ncbi:MAG: flagellar protein FlaG [Sedimenticola sp.]|nr:flagellar protein FlaG [Sedimenticola sp.]